MSKQVMTREREEGDPPALCVWCCEPIGNGDLLAPYENVNMHYFCGLRSIIGGLNHLNGTCSCFGGDEPSDPPGLSTRQAAAVAAQAWLARNPMRHQRP
jgi:hypothetical protein